MSDHVYRKFTKDDIFSTTIRAHPLIVVESGSSGWSGNGNAASGSLSLYGGVRARSDVSSGSASGLQLYPIDKSDTHSIDKIIDVPGSYPATGSINIVTCTNTVQPFGTSPTDTRWYDTHFSLVSRLFEWYRDNVRSTYGTGSSVLSTYTLVHVPSMFYGRQIATGSVFIQDNSYNSLSGTLTYVDDGYGALIVSGSDVYSGKVGNVFYNEGLIVFTDRNHTFGSKTSFTGSGPVVHIEFQGVTLIKSQVFMCRMGVGEVNASNNPTYFTTGSDGMRYAKTDLGTENVVYITGIGIYNEERQLVAVVKLAQPIRKRERDQIDVRVKLDI